MLRLHRQMLGEIWDWAGRLRTSRQNLGVAAHQIAEELKKLEDDIAYWTAEGAMDAFEVSARDTYLDAIHAADAGDLTGLIRLHARWSTGRG